MRALLAVLALFLLFRLGRAARSGRVRLAGDTFARAETPVLYWREMALDALTLVLLAAALIFWGESRPQGGGLAAVLFVLFVELVRLIVPGGRRRLRDLLRPNRVLIALLATAVIAAGAILILKWLGF